MIDSLQKNIRQDNYSNCVFSILIPSWNNIELLKLCIKSIQQNSYYQHQIIVHINEGKDGTINWIEQQKNIDYTYSSANIGVCYALNYAATLVQTNYILYLNDDMYVCPNWDKYLKDEIDAIGHNNFFLSSTAIEPVAQSNCSIQKNYGTNTANFNESLLLQEFEQLNINDWSGATWPPNVVHKDIWHLVGGYSIEYSPGMYSDPDFSMKLWQAGVRIFKGCNKSKVYHFGSQSVKRVKQNKGYYQFIRKWKITSSTFGKLFIKRGKPFNNDLQQLSFSTMMMLKNKFKQVVACFK